MIKNYYGFLNRKKSDEHNKKITINYNEKISMHGI